MPTEILSKIQSFAPSLGVEVRPIHRPEFDLVFRSLVWPSTATEGVREDPGFSLKSMLSNVLQRVRVIYISALDWSHWRIDGSLLPMTGYSPLSRTQLEEIVQTITPDTLATDGGSSDLDFAYEVAGGERFRVNIFRDMNGPAIALRHIPSRVLTLEQLGAPTVLKAVCEHPKGLFLVTSTGGSESATLAAMINQISFRQSLHHHS